MKIKILKKELNLLYHFNLLEGWDIEKLHINTLQSTNSNDFFVAYVDRELIGFVLAIRYSNIFGHISNLLVLKKFRNHGYAKKLLDHAIKHLGSRQIAIDSVKQQQKFYEKFGFTAYFELVTYVFTTDKVKKISPFKIINFNKNLSLNDKDLYTKEILRSKNINYKAIKINNNISSFGFSFKYKDGYKIYIQSTNLDETTALFDALIQKFTNKTNVYIQSSLLTPIITKLTILLNMQKVSNLIRMYNKIL